jgi:cellulose synthase/poly-beta-1,6-N-acetylglucosamine synthase-like glycosyltransferase
VEILKQQMIINHVKQNKMTITEDQAMSMGIELKDLVSMKLKEGYKIKHTYQHPAVGTVVVMEQDYSLAS